MTVMVAENRYAWSLAEMRSYGADWRAILEAQEERMADEIVAFVHRQGGTIARHRLMVEKRERQVFPPSDVLIETPDVFELRVFGFWEKPGILCCPACGAERAPTAQLCPECYALAVSATEADEVAWGGLP